MSRSCGLILAALKTAERYALPVSLQLTTGSKVGVVTVRLVGDDHVEAESPSGERMRFATREIDEVFRGRSLRTLGKKAVQSQELCFPGEATATRGTP